MIKTYFFLFSLFFSLNALSVEDLYPATNLYKSALTSNNKNIPILIMFSIDDCPYCQKVKEEILLPIQNIKSYDDKVIIRHINTSNENDIINFQNNQSSTSELKEFYNINFFPTVILLNKNGRKIANSMIGITTAEQYWQELDNNIQDAIEYIKISKLGK